MNKHNWVADDVRPAGSECTVMPEPVSPTTMMSETVYNKNVKSKNKQTKKNI